MQINLSSEIINLLLQNSLLLEHYCLLNMLYYKNELFYAYIEPLTIETAKNIQFLIRENWMNLDTSDNDGEYCVSHKTIKLLNQIEEL